MFRHAKSHKSQCFLYIYYIHMAKSHKSLCILDIYYFAFFFCGCKILKKKSAYLVMFTLYFENSQNLVCLVYFLYIGTLSWIFRMCMHAQTRAAHSCPDPQTKTYVSCPQKKLNHELNMYGRAGMRTRTLHTDVLPRPRTRHGGAATHGVLRTRFLRQEGQVSCPTN